MQKARGQAFVLRRIALPPLVGKRFRFYFTPLTGVLFAFPSRYWFAIGRQGIFSLGGWSLRIPTGFHVSRGTWVRWPERSERFRLQGFHLLWRLFPEPSTIACFCNSPGFPYQRPATP